MSCEIIQFSARTAVPSAHRVQPEPISVRREEPLTETCKNSRLRIARRDAWWRACRIKDYWRARMDWNHALSCAQSHGIGDANSYPSIENGSRFDLVDKWREAVVKQLLTPAPDGAAVTWKRAQLAGRGFSHLPTKTERIERVIAEDLAFLAAHPTKRSNTEAMTKNREFKDAMRRRIRDIAASRDLPDDEIKSVLRLKHQEIGAFAIKHSVSVGWLLEGVGPIFKKYPQEQDQ
jgi:hypothetical protein